MTDDSAVHDPKDNEKELDGIICECRDGMIAIKAARKDLNEDAKAIRERLKESGLDTDTFDTNVKIYEMERELRAKRMSNFQRYYNAMNEGETVNWLAATQEGDAETEPAPDEEPAIQSVLDELRENGRNAGKMGRDVSSNRYPVDSTRGEAWHDGWLEGQKALADEQFGNTDAA